MSYYSRDPRVARLQRQAARHRREGLALRARHADRDRIRAAEDKADAIEERINHMVRNHAPRY
ncbi:MAG: hypothetical protein ACRDQW_06635 [Haloechinothrix sp.]